ncbi:hypothetical protein E1189_02495 [Sansalvadorimonas verongulae]|nr:hypothetical protein [Sansalvadorimonas verongulae]
MKKLDAVNELKPLVERLLKNWYVHFLGKKRGTNGDIRRILSVASPLAPPMYSGHSPTLESNLKIDNLTPSWTEEPEGVPDIGRLLTGLPAFSVFKIRASKHRPVILAGAPQWGDTSLMKKAHELSEQHCQHCPDKETLRKRLSVMSHQYSELIKEAFVDYLYQIAHVNGEGITACWFDARAGSVMHQTGYHIPQSAAELNALMTEVINHFQWDGAYEHYLRTVLRSHGALVLDKNDLTVIAQEFINRLKLDTRVC